MPRVHYTDEQVGHALAVLRSNGNNLKQTSKHLGIGRSTLRDWAAGKLKQHNAVQVDQTKDSVSTKLIEQFGDIAVRSLTQAATKIDSASYKDLLIGASIATEKRELLRGEPTKRDLGNIRISLVASDGSSFTGLRAASQAVLRGEIIDVQPVHKALGTGG